MTMRSIIVTSLITMVIFYLPLIVWKLLLVPWVVYNSPWFRWYFFATTLASIALPSAYYYPGVVKVWIAVLIGMIAGLMFMTPFLVSYFLLYKDSIRNTIYDASNYVIESAFYAMLVARNVTLFCILAAWEGVVLSTLAAYYVTESTIYNLTPWFLRPGKSLSGKVVLVTGGAGGLGQELALRLARVEAKVVVWDNNERALEKVKTRLEKEGHTVYTYNVDVADRHNVYKNAELVKNEVGVVDILINNAGVVSGHTFLDNPDELVEQTFKVNTLAHYWGIKAFLGDMIKAGEGHIVSVGSLTGSLGTYKCTDYSASKYALNGLHESLAIELKSHGHNIQTTLISPYFINTGMFSGCKPRALSMLEPRYVSKRIIAAIRANETVVSVPSSFGYLIPFKNYLPDKLNWAVYQRVIQGAEAMKGLKGQIPHVQKLTDLPQVQDVAAA